MRVLTTIFSLSIVIVAGCTTSSHRSGAAQSNYSAAAPVAVTGTWEFIVTGKREPQRFSFTLTDTPANTCISGTWYKAMPLSVPSGQVSRPAYQFESGKLEILLSTELCDGYTSFIGKVAGSSFEGAHVSYGLFGNTEHGSVTGSLQP
jgi:hypothetical protein